MDTPIVGVEYLIREWDDSLERVVVLAVQNGEAAIRYTRDGLTHVVSTKYLLSLDPTVLN